MFVKRMAVCLAALALGVTSSCNDTNGESGSDDAGGNDSGGQSGSASGRSALPPESGAGQGPQGDGGAHTGGVGTAGGAGPNANGGDDGGRAMSTGGQGGSDSEGFEDLGWLLGPATDDQAPIVVQQQVGVAASRPLFFDADGSLFMLGSNVLTKYDTTLATVWSFPLNSIPNVTVLPSTFSLGSDGSIGFGGSTDEAVAGHTNAGFTDAVVGKLTKAGAVAWIHQWGSSGQDVARLTAFSADGGLFSWGLSSGQVPGQPAEVAGGPWTALYSGDGETRAWLKQYQKLGVVQYGTPFAFFDAGGQTSIVLANLIQRFDGTGVETMRLKPPTNGGFYLFDPTCPSANGDGLFGFSLLHTAEDSSTSRLAFAFQNLSGGVEYYRSVEPPRTRILDTVEGVTWTGDMAEFGANAKAIAATGNAIYIAGTYRNVYKNGSVAHPSTTPLWVGRYDLKGNRIWFQEILYGSASNIGQASLSGIAVDAAGNVVLSAGTLTNNSYLVKLKASDGTVLQ